MNDLHGVELHEDDVRHVLVHQTIMAVEFHPACVEFTLGRGSVLKMFDGDDQYGRSWHLRPVDPDGS